MAWIKVPPEHHPIFMTALPKDARVVTMKMFGGVAASVKGNMFAGLFGRSVVLALSDADKKKALALDGASLFDPMGNGRVMSDKVMMPEALMKDAPKLRSWMARAFKTSAELPMKVKKAKKAKKR